MALDEMGYGVVKSEMPQRMTPEIRAFLKQLCPRTTAVPVDVKPAPFAKAGNCHANATIQLERHGGEKRFGWAIWQHGRHFIEAEFHCVWADAAGALIDITPKPETKILFLPDDTLRADGEWRVASDGTRQYQTTFHRNRLYVLKYSEATRAFEQSIPDTTVSLSPSYPAAEDRA